MTTDPPAPDSPWATRCPDAYPAEWFDALGLSALPPGFARFATADEVSIITGVTTADPVPNEPRATAPVAPSARRKRVKPAAVMKPEGRFQVVNRFVDVELRALTRAEMAVWMILWRDTKPDGTARTGQTDLARRAGCDARTVRRALDALVARGLVEVVVQGRLRTGPSRYRVRGTALTPAV